MIDAVRVKDPFSDHNIVTCDVIVSVQVKEWRETYYDYKRGNYEEMRKFLSDYDWEQAFQNIDVNTKWDHFKAVVNSAVQRFVPISTKKRNKKPRWMSKRAELARRKKYHMWKRYRETREYHLYEAYKRQRNKAQNEVKKAKRYFEKKLAENIKTDPKSFYAYTRSKTRTKDSVGPLVDLMGEVITDSIQATNLLND